MKRTIVTIVIACAGVLCAGATARVVAVQKNALRQAQRVPSASRDGGNPLLKEPLRLK